MPATIPAARSALAARTSIWEREADGAALAATLAARAAIGEAFVELHGPLGAGKTTFARYLLRALGVDGTIKSPTYALLESYVADAAHGGHAISHFDFYRFDDPAEWEDAGFREVFAAPGLKLVEWPEKAEGLLPICDLRVSIEPRDAGLGAGDDAASEGRRDVRLEALTPLGEALLR